MSRLYPRLILILCMTLCVQGITLAQTDVTSISHWTPAGWGGGGFYYATVFDPFDEGVLYLGSDVLGCYRSNDHGRTWKIINQGIAGYGVFSLAADPSTPGVIYAATTDGLCKSTDRGEHWLILPQTGPNALRITGEKNRSIRSVAVHPTDSRIVFAASPAGKLFKSVDGGMNWAVAYESTPEKQVANALRTQFGKVNGATFGGVWFPVKMDSIGNDSDISSIGLNLTGNRVLPDQCYLTVQLATGERYNSKNFADLLKPGTQQEILLQSQDFKIDGYWASQHKQKLTTTPKTPVLVRTSRIDLVCTGALKNATAVYLSTLFVEQDNHSRHTLIDFKTDTKGMAYGNATSGKAKSGSYYSVAIAPHKPERLIVATADEGLVVTDDGGQTWQSAKVPATASSVCFSGSDSSTVYATFFRDGIFKSDDAGHTWNKITPPGADKTSFCEITADPNNTQNVYVVGSANWNGVVYTSNNGGKEWIRIDQIKPDVVANPTLPAEIEGGKMVGLSNPKNIAINPRNSQELYIAANWRPCISYDGGKTWQESCRGADISCVTDIRFDSKGRVFATAMDEGTLYSDNNGQSWHAMYPPRYNEKTSGHHWRIAVNDLADTQRVLVTCSPWSRYPNCVLLSENGGKTFSIINKGLPDTIPTANTMWGRSYARALAVDPNNQDVIYLGMDGDPSNGNAGGGIFKSIDGGKNWNQLPNQPRSRRMFFGLAVDPTNSNRIYWGAGGSGAGIYRSEDAGNSWQHIYSPDGWVFNLHVTKDGTVYCPGANLYRSTDHGKNFRKISNFQRGRTIVGIEVHPHDPDTIWISSVTWGGASNGAVCKTTDGGKTWTDITGDLPFIKPLVLRFNPHTNELWAGNVGLYKIKQ